VDPDDDKDYLQDKSDGEYNDDDDDDFDDEDDVNKDSSSTIPAEDNYKKQEHTEKSEAGRTVVLRCSGEGFDDTTLFMWYNGSAILLQGESTITHDKRISFSKKDGSLTIKDLSSYDDGTFRCRAFATAERYETLIHLHINGPPRGIRIAHNINSKKNIADETLVYRAGATDLRFECNVEKARPTAKIDWIHNGNTILESQLKDHDIKIDDEGTLIIKTLHARHAGEYQCEASNELGNLKASFKIEAQCECLFSVGIIFRIKFLLL
jgi:hypothetical protein